MVTKRLEKESNEDGDESNMDVRDGVGISLRIYENTKAMREGNRKAKEGGVARSRGRVRSEKTVPLCRHISDAQICVALALSVRYL